MKIRIYLTLLFLSLFLSGSTHEWKLKYTFKALKRFKIEYPDYETIKFVSGSTGKIYLNEKDDLRPYKLEFDAVPGKFYDVPMCRIRNNEKAGNIEIINSNENENF